MLTFQAKLNHNKIKECNNKYDIYETYIILSQPHKFRVGPKLHLPCIFNKIGGKCKIVQKIIVNNKKRLVTVIQSKV